MRLMPLRRPSQAACECTSDNRIATRLFRVLQQVYIASMLLFRLPTYPEAICVGIPRNFQVDILFLLDATTTEGVGNAGM